MSLSIGMPRGAKMVLRRGGLFLFLLLVSACATRPIQPEGPVLSWSQRQQLLEQLGGWSFNGRVAVQDMQADSWSANLRWRQQGDHFEIFLSGALGQGAARIYGNGGQAFMEMAGHPLQSAENPEALMQSQLGWFVPVRGLKYWLVGQPAPARYDHELDDHGRLARLQQDGWQIIYKRYMNVDAVELPRKLELINHRLRVRVVIDQWLLDGVHGS